LVLFVFLFLSQSNEQAKAQIKGEENMKITSSGFENEGMIPDKYTCDGENISPPLEWNNPPDDTKSFALICDDPDAPMGTWVHWVVYDIPASISKLQENTPPEKRLVNGGKQGTNDFHKIGYGGPCPPSGVHRYFFKLYALDDYVDLEPGATKEQLLRAMKGHILLEEKLMGKYNR